MRLSTILAMLSFSLYAGEVEDVKAAIHSNWETIAKGKYPGLTHSEGRWLATSEGGFWSFDSPQDNKNRIENSPNTLNFKPYHINVEIYGSKKEIAYAVYYLAGTIDRDGNVIVPNYRTRASALLKKENGKWYEVGSHYSPMHSGSGVKFD